MALCERFSYQKCEMLCQFSCIARISKKNPQKTSITCEIETKCVDALQVTNRVEIQFPAKKILK